MDKPDQSSRWGPTGSTSRREFVKKAALGTFGLAGASLLAACNTATSSTTSTSGKKGKFVFLTHSVDPFFIPIVVGVREFSKSVGWDYQFVGPKQADNTPQIVDVLDQVLATKPDVLAMTINDPQALNKGIEQALSQNIVVISFNATLDSVTQKYHIPFVGMKDAPAGFINGQLAGKYAQKVSGRTSGEIVNTLIVPGASNLEARAAATADGLKQYNSDNRTNFTLSKFGSDLNENNALQRIQAKWSADQSNIVGWASQDWGDWYIGDFMTQNNLKGKFANGGFDLLPGVMKYMKTGDIQWSLGQNPYAQGYMSCALGYMAVVHHYPASDFSTGPEVVEGPQVAVVAAREAAWANVHVAEISG